MIDWHPSKADLNSLLSLLSDIHYYLFESKTTVCVYAFSCEWNNNFVSWSDNRKVLQNCISLKSLFISPGFSNHDASSILHTQCDISFTAFTIQLRTIIQSITSKRPTFTISWLPTFVHTGHPSCLPVVWHLLAN